MWFSRPRSQEAQVLSAGCAACSTSEVGVQVGQKEKRVLYAVDLDPSKKFGSMEEQIFLMARERSRRGGLFLPVFSHEMGDSQGQRYREDCLDFAVVDLRRFRIRSLLGLARLIDRYGIDVVHWNLYPPANWYVPLLRLIRPRLAHVLTDHNSRPQTPAHSRNVLKRACRKILAGWYAKTFAVSEYVRSDLQRQAIWREPMRFHHFVNTDRFQPDRLAGEKLRTLHQCERKFVALVVAHLIPEKGVDVAIRAAKELPSHVVLWIVGEGSERKRLHELATSLGIEERVLFFGIQSNVDPFMQAADCLVCPSVWQEAAGLVILEALACGLPVIASSVGGIPEFVTSGQTGYLFAAGDHMALMRHLNALVGSPALLCEMSVAARARAVEHFSHTSRVADALALYDVSS